MKCCAGSLLISSWPYKSFTYKLHSWVASTWNEIFIKWIFHRNHAHVSENTILITLAYKLLLALEWRSFFWAGIWGTRFKVDNITYWYHVIAKFSIRDWIWNPTFNFTVLNVFLYLLIAVAGRPAYYEIFPEKHKNDSVLFKSWL